MLHERGFLENPVSQSRLGSPPQSHAGNVITLEEEPKLLTPETMGALARGAGGTDEP